MNWFKTLFKRKEDFGDGKPFGKLISKNGQLRMKITKQAEKDLKDYYDLKMNPREWMARYGHNILAGDARMNIYRDKELEKWVHEAFTALNDEGLEKLWAEFLTDEEIKANKEDCENP